MRPLGSCLLRLTRWRQRRLDDFLRGAPRLGGRRVKWSNIAAILAMNRRCAPAREPAIEPQRYPTAVLVDLRRLPDGQTHGQPAGACARSALPHKAALEHRWSARDGELFVPRSASCWTTQLARISQAPRQTICRSCVATTAIAGATACNRDRAPHPHRWISAQLRTFNGAAPM